MCVIVRMCGCVCACDKDGKGESVASVCVSLCL